MKAGVVAGVIGRLLLSLFFSQNTPEEEQPGYYSSDNSTGTTSQPATPTTSEPIQTSP